MGEWRVFTDRETGRELCAYTVRGTFQDEERATVDLLAFENGIAPDQIEVRTENRLQGRERPL